MTGRAKWDAWNVAGNTYKNDAPKAEARYLQITRDLGWNEDVPVVAEDTSSDTADQNDDIWDSDTGSEGSSRGDGSGGGMGVGVSTMTALGHVEIKSSLSRFALSGDVEGLTSFLDEHPTTGINAPDENGYTSLHLACDRGHIGVVKLLLNRGADMNIKDPDGLTAVELAQISENDEIRTLLEVAASKA